MRRKLFWVITVVVLIALIRFVPSTFFYTPDVGEKNVAIQRGMGMLEIAAHLDRKSVV